MSKFKCWLFILLPLAALGAETTEWSLWIDMGDFKKEGTQNPANADADISFYAPQGTILAFEKAPSITAKITGGVSEKYYCSYKTKNSPLSQNSFELDTDIFQYQALPTGEMFVTEFTQINQIKNPVQEIYSVIFSLSCWINFPIEENKKNPEFFSAMIVKVRTGVGALPDNSGIHWVLPKTTKLFSDKSLTGSALKDLPFDKKLIVLEKNKVFSKVLLATGETGYVNSKDLTEKISKAEAIQNNASLVSNKWGSSEFTGFVTVPTAKCLKGFDNNFAAKISEFQPIVIREFPRALFLNLKKSKPGPDVLTLLGNTLDTFVEDPANPNPWYQLQVKEEFCWLHHSWVALAKKAKVIKKTIAYKENDAKNEMALSPNEIIYVKSVISEEKSVILKPITLESFIINNNDFELFE